MTAVSVAVGALVIWTAAMLGSAVMFVVWDRLAPPVAFGLLGITGALVASGGLLVQEATDVGSWMIAVGLLASLGPLHGRLVFGPPGTRR
jgi:hypothetical protein